MSRKVGGAVERNRVKRLPARGLRRQEAGGCRRADAVIVARPDVRELAEREVDGDPQARGGAVDRPASSHRPAAPAVAKPTDGDRAGCSSSSDRGSTSGCSLRVRAALQVLPLVLRIRCAGDRAIRHTARAGACRLAAAALQPVEPRGIRPGRGPAAVQIPSPRAQRLTMLLTANIFQPLIDVFESVLKFFHNSVGVPWGWSIVLLTVVIRALLIPLTLKQFGSMQKLQRLQPEIKALQAKYKEDKQRQQQEMMKFYKENKVNPFGSCLPLVAQLPVFISLFYMLRTSLRADICPAAAAHTSIVHGSASATSQTAACGGHRRGLPVHQRPDEQGDRRDAGRADRALRRHAAGLEPDDVERDDGPDASADHAVHAADLRALHHQLPGRRDRLLDHDEPGRSSSSTSSRNGGARCSRRRRRRGAGGVRGARRRRGTATGAAAKGPGRRQGWRPRASRRRRRRRPPVRPAGRRAGRARRATAPAQEEEALGAPG